MIDCIEARTEHILPILANLREQERRTIVKLGLKPFDMLTKLIEDGDYPSFTGRVDEVPACMFGVAQLTGLGEPRLWLLTTPMVDQHQVTFLRISRTFCQEARKVFGPLVGMADCEFKKSIAWLKWLGFKPIQQGEYIVMRLE